MVAVIFDLDGTLVDLFELHLRGFRELIGKEYGLTFQRRDLEAHYGKVGEDIARAFFEGHGVRGVDYRDFADRRRQWVIDHISSCSALPGAKRLLMELKSAGIQVALGTSNPKNLGEAILAGCGLDGFFDYASYRDPRLKGKPEPDIFLAAARGLGVEPGVCVVVEDSVWGVAAAKAAGMKVIAVATGTHPRKQLERLRPDLLVDTLEQVGLDDVRGLAS